MRITPIEKELIKRTAQECFDAAVVVRLFGSRVDDSKKGGDIDLFFESSITLDLKHKLALEYRLSAECDTKVDLLVKNPGQEENAIFEIARSGAPL